MTTNDQLILTGGQAWVRELCWQIYRFNLHVISNHTPYLQTLGFHGRIRVTTKENKDKVGRKFTCCTTSAAKRSSRMTQSDSKTRSTTRTLKSGTKPAHHGKIGYLNSRNPRSKDIGSLQWLWILETQTSSTSRVPFASIIPWMNNYISGFVRGVNIDSCPSFNFN